MKSALAGRAFRAVAVALGAIALCANALASTPSRKSPFVEIVGQARVETAPQHTVHKNHREFLEFDVTLTEVKVSAEQPAHADRNLVIDLSGRVRVVHDLTCGGRELALSTGDRIELEGEYVHIGKGKDLIHFTHRADAGRGCGSGSSHPGGFLRKLPPPTAGPRATPPPAAAVPDQPWTGPPPPDTKPYLEIMRLRESGQSNEALLKKVQTEDVRYSLTTAEIQKLRASGVSTAVIEAMLASGRTVLATPTPR